MKKYITLLFVFIASTATCFADGGDTYNSSNGQVLFPSITVGNTIYTNVIITVGQILAVGGSSPVPTTSNTTVAATCNSSNFTTAKFNAITAGMTLLQVEQTIGCLYSPYLTQRTVSSVIYAWNNGSPMIVVWFDANGAIATPIGAGAPVKSSSGF